EGSPRKALPVATAVAPAPGDLEAMAGPAEAFRCLHLRLREDWAAGHGAESTPDPGARPGRVGRRHRGVRAQVRAKVAQDFATLTLYRWQVANPGSRARWATPPFSPESPGPCGFPPNP